jgi:hypothetical protein
VNVGSIRSQSNAGSRNVHPQLKPVGAPNGRQRAE